MSAAAYPVKVDASLDPGLSRWLWLVKWVLAIPHYIVLALLWVAFVVLSVVAFFAILFTGRYPRAIFDFNVGVLRWTWRVQYYAYGALGTDRYPPFSLRDDPGYPARLEIEYPERLSRGLVLVKWWLLAIPQYIIVGLLAGGGLFAAARLGQHASSSWPGLIGVLVLIAGVMLACTGRYPAELFDLVLGLNRWVLRVAAYAGLMTDKYPPFRLDLGGHEPAGLVSLGRPGGVDLRKHSAGTEPPGDRRPAAGPPATPRGWTAGRIVSVVFGSVAVLIAAGLLAGAAGALWADQTHRVDGYVTTPAVSYSTGRYALATEPIVLPGAGWNWVRSSVIGKIRIQVATPGSATTIFVGIARAAAVDRYLTDVRYATISGSAGNALVPTHHGTKAPEPPGMSKIWAVRATGTGHLALTWSAPPGTWVVVAMNPDASPGVSVRADVGATMPGLPWVEAGLLAVGAALLICGVLLIAVPIRRAGQ